MFHPMRIGGASLTALGRDGCRDRAEIPPSLGARPASIRCRIPASWREEAPARSRRLVDRGFDEEDSMRFITGLALTSMLAMALGTSARAQTPADSTAIRGAALDYIEGWYEGNAERMERALHPELAKRIVRTTPEGKSRLDQMGAMTLVQGTRAGGGKSTPKEQQQKDVTILDIYRNAASVKIVASKWIDYLHLAKFNDRWVIVNVLWELKPTAP